MILGFRHKGLRELFFEGSSKSVPSELTKRCFVRLDALNVAGSLRDLDLPGFHCHPLQGTSPERHSVAVNGPWRITFVWTDRGPDDVDLVQYH
ncbi:MAG: type II toxin-antitoxin system RelE/ParE family toxin [Geminicoccaceae bacterium]|nr:type II toxin-antitoxin system RelE/ParE family toxin [Geminicoccaceae bacterium]